MSKINLLKTDKKDPSDGEPASKEGGESNPADAPMPTDQPVNKTGDNAVEENVPSSTWQQNNDAQSTDSTTTNDVETDGEDSETTANDENGERTTTTNNYG